MSNKNQNLTFEESLKKSSRKELRKICKHFQRMNILTMASNYSLNETNCSLNETITSLQNELANTQYEVEHKDRLLNALTNS